jgi:2-oxoisovalerate dehydrogenase E2 component (dihydrolipoyl transacylase)
MSPILVPGEAAIGAMGAMQKVPKYAADGSLQPCMVMKMSWAADHRLLAGATVARFSNRFKALIQDPALMLVALR